MRLPAVRMVRHKESMITSNVDLNSDGEEIPENDPFALRGDKAAPQISIHDLATGFD